MAETNSRSVYLWSSQNKIPLRNKIESRYIDAVNKINRSYDSSAAQVKKRYDSYRNQAGAQAAIVQSNTASTLAQKGLSKSGESIQSSLLNDMSYMNALSNLGKQESNELSDLNAKRMSAISGIQNDMLNAQNEADLHESELEYKKARDAKADEQWEKNFNYNASRDSVSDYKWEKELERQKSRDAESDRKWNVEQGYKIERDNKADEQWLQEQNRKSYESARSYGLEREKLENDKAQQAERNKISQRELDIRENNYNNENNLKSRELNIKNQYLELEKQKQSEKQTEKQASTTSPQKKVSDKIGYVINDEGYIVPEISPSEFMEIIIEGGGLGSWTTGEFIKPGTLKQRTEDMINNPDIDPDYRRVLRIYARARGIIK